MSSISCVINVTFLLFRIKLYKYIYCNNVNELYNVNIES